MKLKKLVNALSDQMLDAEHADVCIVINGIKYQIEDVWLMEKDGPNGTVCIGEDPR